MRLKSGLFTSTLVVGSAIFLIIIGGWKDFTFWNDKIPGFWHSCNLFECILNKDIGWNKTLWKRQYTNGSFIEQPFLNKGSNKWHSLHRERKKGTGMWNASIPWTFSLLHASNVIMKTEDNSVQRQAYDS